MRSIVFATGSMQTNLPHLSQSHVRTPSLETKVDILYKNMLTSPFSDKFNCHMFQTLGKNHTGSMETCHVFRLLWFYIGVLGHNKLPPGVNSSPL